MKKKRSFFQAKYHKLTLQTGSKGKAKVAIANHLARVIYTMMIKNTPYKERGALAVSTTDNQIKNAIRKLKSLGVDVAFHTETKIEAVKRITHTAA